MVRVAVSYSKPTVQAPHTGQEVEAKSRCDPSAIAHEAVVPASDRAED